MALDKPIGLALILGGIGIFAYNAPIAYNGYRIQTAGYETQGVVTDRSVDVIGGAASSNFNMFNVLFDLSRDRSFTVRYTAGDTTVSTEAPVSRGLFRETERGDTIPIMALAEEPALVDAEPWGHLKHAAGRFFVGTLFLLVGYVLAFVVAGRD